jgi:hypothetical protein
MASYLIVKVVDNVFLATPEKECLPEWSHGCFHKRRKAVEPFNPISARGLLAEHGWEMGHLVGARVGRWPQTALVYASPNKDGHGRAGSSLYRIPVRRRE